MLKPDIYANTRLKFKPTKFGFGEEKCLISDFTLEYWSMEMVIKGEPTFTWFHSCNKTLCGQCPLDCLHGMWATPPATPVGAHCSF